MKVCGKCLSKVKDGQAYCTECGANLQLPDSTIEMTPVSKTGTEEPVPPVAAPPVYQQNVPPQNQPVPNRPPVYNAPPQKKNSGVTFGIILLVIIVIAAIAIAAFMFASNADDGKIETNGHALWEAGNGTTMEYVVSYGKYTNIYDESSPRKVTGGYKLWVTSCTSTSITMGSDGKITIEGMGDTPTNFGGTVSRDSIKNDTSSTIQTISTKAGDVRCYVIVQNGSSGVYDTVKVTTYRGVDDGVMYKRVYEQSAHSYGNVVMSCDVTYTLKSLNIQV